MLCHDDLFGQDTDDEIWLRTAGAADWIVLTKDSRILHRPGERAAILAAGARCFVLHPSKGMTGVDMAEALIRALPEILAVSAREPGPFIKGINRSGVVRHLAP